MFNLSLSTNNLSSVRNVSNDVLFAVRSTHGQLGFNSNAAKMAGVITGGKVALVELPGRSETTPANVRFDYGVKAKATDVFGNPVVFAIVSQAETAEAGVVGKKTGDYMCLSSAAAWSKIGGDEEFVSYFKLVPTVGVQVVQVVDGAVVRLIKKGEVPSPDAVQTWNFDGSGQMIAVEPSEFEANKVVFITDYIETVAKQVRERKASDSEAVIEDATETAEGADADFDGGFDDL